AVGMASPRGRRKGRSTPSQVQSPSNVYLHRVCRPVSVRAVRRASGRPHAGQVPLLGTGGGLSGGGTRRGWFIGGEGPERGPSRAIGSPATVVTVRPGNGPNGSEGRIGPAPWNDS